MLFGFWLLVLCIATFLAIAGLVARKPTLIIVSTVLFFVLAVITGNGIETVSGTEQADWNADYNKFTREADVYSTHDYSNDSFAFLGFWLFLSFGFALMISSLRVYHSPD